MEEIERLRILEKKLIATLELIKAANSVNPDEKIGAVIKMLELVLKNSKGGKK